MIVIYHQNNKVYAVEDFLLTVKVSFDDESIIACFFEMAKKYPDRLIFWCHISQKGNLNFEAIKKVFHHQKIMASYTTSRFFYLPESIGYVEESLFINVNKDVPFPTWQMSSCVGGIQAAVLLAAENVVSKQKDFDYFLVSLAKLMMPKGLLCYSAPSLLLNISSEKRDLKVASSFVLFRFVKEHYRTRWLFLLLFNFLLYEKRLLIFAFISALFYKQLKVSDGHFDSIAMVSSKNGEMRGSIDVVIPTIGRKKYLYDVLCDLRFQSCLPARVIIVEQNPISTSESELDYLSGEDWPFEIVHHFTHQTGACNARNIALEHVVSDWVFLADDDIRIESDFFIKAFAVLHHYQNEVVTFNCLQKGEKVVFECVFQWSTFGSGCSMISKEALGKLRFDMKYEFGFGEDADFGMQLRNRGYDVLYVPEPQILHLKAPIGGFRSKYVFAWQDEELQPKPSPTVMSFLLAYHTPKQLLGYKTVLFFKFYSKQSIKNPIRYYLNFTKRWRRSVYWAEKLSEIKTPLKAG